MIIFAIIAGVVLFNESSSTSNTNLKEKITFKKALEKIKELDKVEIGKGLIEVSTVTNANIYFIKNSQKYNISYFSNNNKSGTNIPKNCIDKKKDLDKYFKKNNFSKKVCNKKDLEKYISLIKKFCATI